MVLCKEKLSINDLTEVFRSGCKTDEFIGLEYERLPINRYNKCAVSYYGDLGICEILKDIAKIDNWDYIEDDGEIIGLKKIHDTITLEPGSQIELSIEPQKTVKAMENKVN